MYRLAGKAEYEVDIAITILSFGGMSSRRLHSRAQPERRISAKSKRMPRPVGRWVQLGLVRLTDMRPSRSFRRSLIAPGNGRSFRCWLMSAKPFRPLRRSPVTGESGMSTLGGSGDYLRLNEVGYRETPH